MTGKLGFRRLGDQKVEMTYELILDPGGYIPAWIANILLRDAPTSPWSGYAASSASRNTRIITTITWTCTGRVARRPFWTAANNQNVTK